MPNLKLTCLCLLLLQINYSFGQETEEIVKSYTTQRVSGSAPEIDGLLSDEAWSQVDWGGDFIGHLPNYKSSPSQDTKFKILYDDKFLYVGIRAFDSNPEEIVKRMSRRDGFDGDWIEMNIDSYGDKRTAFSFTASVSGVKGDEYVSNNGQNWDSTWDPIWYLKTSVDDKGWIAEFKIPLSQLRFANKEIHRWGIQFTRRFFREEERWTWQPIDPNAPGWVHLFGELNGITGIKPQKQLEIQPYIVGATSKYPKEIDNPYLEKGTRANTSIGLDAKIGLTSDITLDLTVNPDFGQVDADPSAVNLGAYRLFFREQRPFFLEGNNILTFGTSGGQNNLFYSRRIGGPPSISFDFEDGQYGDDPGGTRILGAAKFTGKNAKGFSWAFQEAVTEKLHARITDTDGSERKEVVEPLTNYAVARVQQDLNEGKTVFGAIFTNVNRFNNRGNALELLHDNAQSAGVDIVQNLFDRKYTMGFKIGMSRVEGTQGAIYETQTASERFFQRPDNDYRSVDSTRTSLTGSFSAWYFGKQAGKFNWLIGTNYRSPELALNDIGFLQFTDQVNNWVNLDYRINDKTELFRQQRFRFYHEQNLDFGGTHLGAEASARAYFQFHNFWEFETGAYTRGQSIANADLRGGPSLTYPGGSEMWWWFGSNRQKKVRFSANYWVFKGNENYNLSQGLNFNLTLRPTDALNISFSPEAVFRDNAMQYVENNNEDDGVYTLGRIEYSEYSMEVRANYNVTPNLTIEFWGQPFLSSGVYSAFKEVTNSNDSELSNRYSEIDDLWISEIDEVYGVDEDGDLVSEYTFDKPDFNEIQFRSNFVVRWEYVPGSTVFLVWSNNGQNSNQNDRNSFSQLSSQMGDLRGTNTFLVKYTYRFIL